MSCENRQGEQSGMGPIGRGGGGVGPCQESKFRVLETPERAAGGAWPRGVRSSACRLVKAGLVE